MKLVIIKPFSLAFAIAGMLALLGAPVGAQEFGNHFVPVVCKGIVVADEISGKPLFTFHEGVTHDPNKELDVEGCSIRFPLRVSTPPKMR